MNCRIRRTFSVQFQNNQDESKKEGPRIQVIVGICAMEKKSLSKPMKEILSRMTEFEHIKTIIFPEDVIVNVRILFLFVIGQNSLKIFTLRR